MTNPTHTQKNEGKQGNKSNVKSENPLVFHSVYAEHPTQSIVQRRLQETASNSTQVNKTAFFQDKADQKGHGGSTQKIQTKSDAMPIQRMKFFGKAKDLAENVMVRGEEVVDRGKAKFASKKAGLFDRFMGAIKGGGVSSAYQNLDPLTEEDAYNDIQDEKAEGRERMANHPVLETARKVGLGALGSVAKTGGEVGGEMLAGPAGGFIGKKLAGMGVDKLDELAKEKLNEGGNPYRIIR
jgi:hypothetical protein